MGLKGIKTLGGLTFSSKLSADLMARAAGWLGFSIIFSKWLCGGRGEKKGRGDIKWLPLMELLTVFPKPPTCW